MGGVALRTLIDSLGCRVELLARAPSTRAFAADSDSALVLVGSSVAPPFCTTFVFSDVDDGTSSVSSWKRTSSTTLAAMVTMRRPYQGKSLNPDANYQIPMTLDEVAKNGVSATFCESAGVGETRIQETGGGSSGCV